MADFVQALGWCLQVSLGNLQTLTFGVAFAGMDSANVTPDRTITGDLAPLLTATRSNPQMRSLFVGLAGLEGARMECRKFST